MTTKTYPRDVAKEVCLRRPDLCASDAVAVTLTQNPNLTADEVIEILDDAAEEYAQEQASQ